MRNPWKSIELEKYEAHMRLDSVLQLQTLNRMMAAQLSVYPAASVMILGIAGGNGLEHIHPQDFSKVYGVDINEAYLNACSARYPALQGIFEPICVDLTQESAVLPHADLLIANLLIEYIGYGCFQQAVMKAAPHYISCIIQRNTDDAFVSDSPYLHVFDRLEEVHHDIQGKKLADALRQIGYAAAAQEETPLPNGKGLLRLDFIRKHGNR